MKSNEQLSKGLVRGKLSMVYKTSDGEELADPEKDREGWMQIDPCTRRKVIPITSPDPSLHPLFRWKFEQELECLNSPTGKHSWKTQTSRDEDRTLPRGDWGLIIGTFCIYCLKIKKA